jgi:hypothetical protein
MVSDPSSPQHREAIEELHLYLSDVVPPLVAADAFKVLVTAPADVTAAGIREWMEVKRRRGPEIPTSDYLHYALQKVFLMGQFGLLPGDLFERFLGDLRGLLVASCPEEEREALAGKLAGLPESTKSLRPSDGVRIRQAVAGEEISPLSPRSAPLSNEQRRDLRRFELLLERLARRAAAGSGSGGGSDPVVCQALAAAIRSSRDSREFEGHAERLRRLGVATETADIFRALGRCLPGWLPAQSGEAGSADGEPGAAPRASDGALIEALRRVVVLPEDPTEVARRFHQMVVAAVERFNEGAAAQAAAMLSLADRLIAGERVDAGTARTVKHGADEALDLERLRRCAETPRLYPLIRRILDFFAATGPKSLLDELVREEKRERRKLILQLLEVHGAPVRREALDRLRRPFGEAEGDETWHFRRNLLYLLRRIPPASGEVASDEDVDATARHAVSSFPAVFVREAVAALGHFKHERAEAALRMLVEELEEMLEKPGSSPYDRRETRQLLDRAATALARVGTSSARRDVVEYALKRRREPERVAKLSELAGQDLSTETELVDRLLGALKASSPRRVFRIALQPRDDAARHVIEALSATPAPSVRKAFESLASRFPGEEIGKAAASALSSLDSSGRTLLGAPESLSGDLEPFGLPALLLDLAGLKLSGTLRLKDPKGKLFGEIVLRGGAMTSCRSERLEGETGFYQLVERPAAGAYVLEWPRASGAGETPAGASLELLPLCLEGMRRYDDLQQSVALVPDDMRLAATAVRPERHPDEVDGMFVNGLWNLASGGSTALDCEQSLAADSYRIRRQLAYWVESGALRAVD